MKKKNELIKEIRHGVRIHLQVLRGLPALHINQAADSKNILFEFQNQILAISEVHNYMYRSDNHDRIDFSRVIPKIIENLKNKRKDSKANIVNRSQKIDLTIETASPCAPIFYERFKNPIQRNYTEFKKPNIEIHFCKTKDHYLLTLKNNGSGNAIPISINKPKTTGFTPTHILSKQFLENFELVTVWM